MVLSFKYQEKSKDLFWNPAQEQPSYMRTLSTFENPGTALKEQANTLVPHAYGPCPSSSTHSDQKSQWNMEAVHVDVRC
jgi:hypothetical protein